MKITDQILSSIFDREDVPANEAMRKSMARQLSELGEKAQAMFDAWYVEGERPKFEEKGISSQMLRDKYKMSDVAIILSYDHILKQPKEAQKVFIEKPLM